MGEARSEILAAMAGTKTSGQKKHPLSLEEQAEELAALKAEMGVK